ncbi:uncharacterized protein EDB91DRAFT_1249253 [Suillus paluster]|uniref:uncharacterized protein n=1 Tax=Suillus paluster TaxID=48578 RepID=UPI001B880206|nr:uncharacterized protein EDB91DRAFT_1249253 [Suillus paluster]KAG1738331.1 hypothetical protein EDB91DRAFT_1249253 [Suillus paluster]
MSRILNLSWYMYELSGAALNCAIRRAATGRLSKSKNVLPFSTHEFQPVAIGIWNAMRKYLDSPELDEGEFLPRMTAHHEQCLKALRSRTGEALPIKKYNIYVPSSSSELYRSVVSTSASTPSSNSVPSLTPQNTLASSSSSLSNALWYPKPCGFVDSPQVAQNAPCVPDGSSQGFYYSGETPSGFQPQPEYRDHIPPESHSYREETLDHRDLPPFMQDNLQHNNHFYFTSGLSAGWGASEGSSSLGGALLP